MQTLTSLNNDDYLKTLKGLLESAQTQDELHKTVVNAPFTDRRRATTFGLGISVLLLVNQQTETIDRVALSETDLAKGTLDMSVKPFRAIRVPLNYHGNIIAEAIRSRRYQSTSDWQYLFVPELSAEEARLNQAGGGISCSFIYPLLGIKSGGALIFSYYITIDKVGSEHKDFMFRYAKLVSSALAKFEE